MRNILDQLKRYYQAHLQEAKIIFQLVDIDTKKSLAMLQIKNKKTVLKIKIATLMQSPWLMESLSPLDACQIGVFYGAKPHMEDPCASSSPPHIVQHPFYLKASISRYQLISEDRDQLLHYLDSITKQVFIESPLTIVQSHYVIRNFDATQAFYIGYLAGMIYHKLVQERPQQLHQLSLKTLLRLVDSLNE
ncbi:MAG: hypothetical protein GY821_13360 [Gammaproteobacteria bacterium]|nr:hypothetical protein [Gammaproteobacteria bacterium]